VHAHRVYGPTPTYGGNGLVIDNAGILWSGSGALDNSLLWLDTNNVTRTGTVAIAHAANVLALDMKGERCQLLLLHHPRWVLLFTLGIETSSAVLDRAGPCVFPRLAAQCLVVCLPEVLSALLSL
jgi:hypothetical protein